MNWENVKKVNPTSNATPNFLSLYKYMRIMWNWNAGASLVLTAIKKKSVYLKAYN